MKLLKLWRSPPPPVEDEIVELPAKKPTGYLQFEPLDTTEPIDSMRLYTQADYDDAIKLGQSMRPDYKTIYQYGFAEGRNKPRPRPPALTFNQKDALFKAYLDGIDTVIDKLGLGGFAREEFNMKARELYLAEQRAPEGA